MSVITSPSSKQPLSVDLCHYTRDSQKPFNVKQLRRETLEILKEFRAAQAAHEEVASTLERMTCVSGELSQILTYIDSPAFQVHPLFFNMNTKGLQKLRTYPSNGVLHLSLHFTKVIQMQQKRLHIITASVNAHNEPLFRIAKEIEHLILSRIVQNEQPPLHHPFFPLTSPAFFVHNFAYCTFKDSYWEARMATMKIDHPLSVYYTVDSLGEQLLLDDNLFPFQGQGIALYTTSIMLNGAPTPGFAICYYCDLTGSGVSQSLSFSIQENPDHTMTLSPMNSSLVHQISDESLDYIIDAAAGDRSILLVRVHKGGRKESMGSLHFQKKFLKNILRWAPAQKQLE